jgi:hypothetical protein
MPWHRFITSRRHPASVGLYGFTLIMGGLFLFGAIDSPVISHTIGPWWQIVWEWLLFLGGLAGVVGIVFPDKRIEDALSLEIAGAAMSACGLGVYFIAIVLVAGWSTPVWLIGVLAASLAWRAVQAHVDRRTVERIAAQFRKGTP